MKSFVALIGVFVIALLWMGPDVTAAKEAKYAGIEGCTAKCHKKEKDGDQRGKWLKSDHAKSFKSLADPKAKERAQKLGITTDPQQTEACLICHTTAYGVDKKLLDKRFKMEDGVQCEACHGAGSEYKKKKTMNKIFEERGTDRKKPSPTAKEVGLIVPDEASCKVCHQKEREWNGKKFTNPSMDKPFNFEEAKDKIKHEVPEKKAGAKEEKEEEEEEE